MTELFVINGSPFVLTIKQFNKFKKSKNLINSTNPKSSKNLINSINSKSSKNPKI